LKQVDSVAREFGIEGEARQDFGTYIEEQKAAGRRGTKNERGDFTYQELRVLAAEFLEGGM